MLSYADRLNQLPLSIIGTALGVAILPSISQAIARDNEAEAADVQARAFDLSMLLTLPATLALAVGAVPIIGALFQGGEYTMEAARTTGNILAILVTGLPAYVLVKVLTPAFYARKDVKTPVLIAVVVLVLSIPANFLLIPRDRHLQPGDGHLDRRLDQFPGCCSSSSTRAAISGCRSGWSAASLGK